MPCETWDNATITARVPGSWQFPNGAKNMAHRPGEANAVAPRAWHEGSAFFTTKSPENGEFMHYQNGGTQTSGQTEDLGYTPLFPFRRHFGFGFAMPFNRCGPPI